MIKALLLVLLLAGNVGAAEFLVMKQGDEIGDICAVYPDGACTEQPAPDGTFYIVKITGLPYTTAVKYAEAYTVARGTETVILGRCRYKVRLADIPSTIKNKLASDGWITVTLTQIRNYIRNQETGLNE